MDSGEASASETPLIERLRKVWPSDPIHRPKCSLCTIGAQLLLYAIPVRVLTSIPIPNVDERIDRFFFGMNSVDQSFVQ
jgi:hypothetical protein